MSRIRDGKLPLGKRPHSHDPRDLEFARYVNEAALLPTLPAGDLGHARLHTRADWGMLGNGPDDSVKRGFRGAGNCVFAGAAHEHELALLEAGGAEATDDVLFTGREAIADYSAVTGYVIGDDSTDQGTNMRDALLYRQKTGVVDVNGTRHKIGAFVKLANGDRTQLKLAIYCFGFAAIGIEFPDSADQQFADGKPWDVVKGARNEGGHYIPFVYYDATVDLFYCVTWGRLQAVTAAFIKKQMDEGYAVISPERMANGATLEGFNVDQLTADLAQIGKPTPAPAPPTPKADNISRAAAVAALTKLPAV